MNTARAYEGNATVKYLIRYVQYNNYLHRRKYVVKYERMFVKSFITHSLEEKLFAAKTRNFYQI